MMSVPTYPVLSALREFFWHTSFDNEPLCR